MITACIFVLGLMVTSLVVAGVLQVALDEAADPAHSRPQDLTSWERSQVAHVRDDVESPGAAPEATVAQASAPRNGPDTESKPRLVGVQEAGGRS